MDYSILSVIGIVFSIAMMGILVYKGLNTGVATVISTCAVALCSGIPVPTSLPAVSCSTYTENGPFTSV